MNGVDRYILFTVDLEDWFQVENLKPGISRSSWSSRELRVERNTLCILDLLESVKRGSAYDPLHATFFVLGWIAERLPHLVREIHSRGHEVASHGYSHQCSYDFSSDNLKGDLLDSKKLLEDVIGDRVYGYRAPSFSINNDVLKIVESCGYSFLPVPPLPLATARVSLFCPAIIIFRPYRRHLSCLNGEQHWAARSGKMPCF